MVVKVLAYSTLVFCHFLFLNQFHSYRIRSVIWHEISRSSGCQSEQDVYFWLYNSQSGLVELWQLLPYKLWNALFGFRSPRSHVKRWRVSTPKTKPLWQCRVLVAPGHRRMVEWQSVWQWRGSSYIGRIIAVHSNTLWRYFPFCIGTYWYEK
jgi:hypothetical protein